MKIRREWVVTMETSQTKYVIILIAYRVEQLSLHDLYVDDVTISVSPKRIISVESFAR